MKLYLICDNGDTAVGMRLAGVEGVVVSDEASAAEALEAAVKDEEIAVVLMNQSLYSACDSLIKSFRKAHTTPLIIEIPDKNSQSAGNSLAKYIRETVGISI
ncbi:MAG: V-type ATP synthase subunit F [Clostridia bacterium]|nr:V-type ATP synthase subunit F [Clostridia bacterium]MCQ2479199.1 V-type ATP synthase subunit F [Clostridia bacterium]